MVTKRVSILGSGWLGLPLIKALKDAGFHVAASTRTESRLTALEDAGATAFLVDLGKLSQASSDFFDAELLIINITSKSVEHFSELADIVALSRVEKVLFISSTAVYRNAIVPLSEDNGLENKQHPLYLIERLFCDNSGFNTTVIRFAGLVGTGRHPGRFFRARPIKDPQAPVNLIYLDDCIGIIEAIVEQNAWGQVFNACADTHPTKQSFYTHAALMYGLNAPELGEQSDGPVKLIDNSKLKKELNYSFKHSDVCKALSTIYDRVAE